MIFNLTKEYPLELIRWLIPADKPRAKIYTEIQGEIENNEDNIFIMRAYDKQEIQAIVIMINCLDHVWLWQFRCRPHFKCKKEMWDAARDWTKSKNKDRIETKTYSERLGKHFERCFGFEKIGDKLVYKINRSVNGK